MKKTNKLFPGLIASALVCFMLFAASCEKEETPEYVGIWQGYSVDNLQRFTFEFKKSSYNLTVAQNLVLTTVDIAGLRGAMDVADRTLTGTVDEAGIAISDTLTGNISPINYLATGDTGFDQVLLEMGNALGLGAAIPPTFSGTYTLNGDTMTLTSALFAAPMKLVKQ